MQQENIIQALHYYEQCIDNYDNCSDISFQSTISTIQEDTNSPSQNKAKLLMAKILSKSGKETEAIGTHWRVKSNRCQCGCDFVKGSYSNSR